MKEELARVRASYPGQHPCLWARDESRFGRRTIQRRRLTPHGIKPVSPFEQTYQSFRLCGAVQPDTGENFILKLPATDSDCPRVFLDEVRPRPRPGPR